jgi:predicted enzyme related to lactoylglutathione lyase
VNRLLYVMPYTSDIEGMKRYYSEAVGLEIRNQSPAFVQFAGGSDGASFALLAVRAGQPHETELCFEAPQVDESFRALQSRGVVFLDEPRTQSFGRVVHLRDPEGNLLSLLQPAPGLGAARAPETMNPDPEWQSGMVGALAAATKSSPVALASAARAPRFSTAIINCRDIPSMRAFYRERLGLKVEFDSPEWVTLTAGATTLALHPAVDRPERERRGPAITLGFSIGDLMEWADQARERGVHFDTAPTNRGWGLSAGATDPDGNDLVFREPAAPPALEEELADAFEDDAAPHQSAIRKPVKKGARAVSRVAVKPEYKANGGGKPKKAARIAEAKKKGRTPPSIRGGGPERTRLAQKNLDDPKRPNLRQAAGRLKKAERRSVTNKKRAVASASKGKPVKRAASSRRGKKR